MCASLSQQNTVQLKKKTTTHSHHPFRHRSLRAQCPIQSFPSCLILFCHNIGILHYRNAAIFSEIQHFALIATGRAFLEKCIFSPPRVYRSSGTPQKAPGGCGSRVATCLYRWRLLRTFSLYYASILALLRSVMNSFRTKPLVFFFYCFCSPLL